MLAGTLGGLLTTWVTFTPCFLWIFLGAPFIERLRGNKALSGALAAITAAVVGVILNLAVWFALHTWFRETRPVRAMGFGFDAPGARQPGSLGARALCGGDDRGLPVQSRHDPDAADLLGRRGRPPPCGSRVMHRRTLIAGALAIAAFAPAKAQGLRATLTCPGIPSARCRLSS